MRKTKGEKDKGIKGQRVDCEGWGGEEKKKYPYIYIYIYIYIYMYVYFTYAQDLKIW